MFIVDCCSIAQSAPTATADDPHQYNADMLLALAHIPINRNNIIIIIIINSGNKSNTFKPKKCHDRGTKRYELHKQAKATLGSGNLKAAVALPESEDMNEWLAVNSMCALFSVGCCMCYPSYV
jgi:hypothetical protein